MSFKVNSIPTDNLVTAAKRRLSQIGSHRKNITEFINTESNKDNYYCEIICRKVKKKWKIKLVLYTGILDYAAFEEIWIFEKNQKEIAISTYNQLCNEIKNIEEQYNRSMTPSATLLPMIREAIKDISSDHKFKTNIYALDKSDSIKEIEPDWRQSIYGNKYVSTTGEGEVTYYEHNQEDALPNRKQYTTREKY